MSLLSKNYLSESIKFIVIYFRVLWKRMGQVQLNVLAGHLAYVSLLSLVPLITVIFSLFAAFPMFSEISEQLKLFIFTNFVPAAGSVVQGYLEQFVANSSKMTAVGICGLVVTALLLIASIDEVINSIWGVKKKRPAVYSFAIYWMILTLGPLLAGGSMAISSVLLSQKWLNDVGVTTLFNHVFSVFPLILSFATFWLVYSIVPNVRVPTKDAAIGAIIAALLFEFGKIIFSMYVTLFPSYQLIYGVLAVIPILFVWVYMSWYIVLFGVQITVCLSEHRVLRNKYAEIIEDENLS